MTTLYDYFIVCVHLARTVCYLQPIMFHIVQNVATVSHSTFLSCQNTEITDTL